MKAVFETGGKQYFVKENDEIFVELIAGEVGSTIEFDHVLVLDEKIGAPYVNGAKIVCEIAKHGKQIKIIVFKYKPKKKYRKKQGHRQPYTKLIVKKIVG